MAHMANSFTSKLKGIQACSGTPLSDLPPGRFLVGTDWIFHQYSQPLRPVQMHQVEYVASRTSPTRVHVLRTIGWLRRRTFQSSRVLFEASPPRWAVRPHSPLESPQVLPHLEQSLWVLQSLTASSPGILTRSWAVEALLPSLDQNPPWSSWASRFHLCFGT